MDAVTLYRLNLLTMALALITLSGCSTKVQYKGKKYVREGWPFTITCHRSTYDGIPKWTKDGDTLKPYEGNSHFMTDDKKDGSVLIMTMHVNFAKLDDKGEYKCDTVSNLSHTIDVIPATDSDEKNRPDTVLLRKNETLELYCADVNNSVFQVNWYKDGHRVLNSDRINITGPKQRTLTVRNATEKDAGDYLCPVEKAGLSYPGSKHWSYLIQVTYGARVEKFPSQIRPIFGRNFILECKVHGYPTPRITWSIDGEPSEIFLQNSSRMSILDNEEGLPDSVLFIQNVTYEDGHSVSCQAKNFQGSDETSVLLAVIKNMISTNEIYPGKGIILSPGKDLVLYCNTTDNPHMEVNWFKNGNPINATDERIDVKTDYTLTIVRTTEGDTGNYMCVTDGNLNATIVVRSEIKLLPFDHSRNIVEGQNIILTCNVTQGIPLPTLQWLKDGEALNLSDPRILTEADNKGIDAAKLTIKEAEFSDRAEYTCLSTNELGSVNASILVRVKDKYAALWPFLGICAEVAILCTIIFIYEKKRQKPDYDESEADHNTENKTVPDQEDKSQDVRQRK